MGIGLLLVVLGALNILARHAVSEVFVAVNPALAKWSPRAIAWVGVVLAGVGVLLVLERLMVTAP
jgi:hypothetical protein